VRSFVRSSAYLVNSPDRRAVITIYQVGQISA
jgi:hypothetical protein